MLAIYRLRQWAQAKENRLGSGPMLLQRAIARYGTSEPRGRRSASIVGLHLNRQVNRQAKTDERRQIRKDQCVGACD